ncbi:hypothetical protein FPQ18DRAFT_426036 [Pyronema domesticum]|nr:hypothetical protein FPQ18DRAFT_426036 [Pyronema domesticum]
MFNVKDRINLPAQTMARSHNNYPNGHYSAYDPFHNGKGQIPYSDHQDLQSLIAAVHLQPRSDWGSTPRSYPGRGSDSVSENPDPGSGYGSPWIQPGPDGSRHTAGSSSGPSSGHPAGPSASSPSASGPSPSPSSNSRSSSRPASTIRSWSGSQVVSPTGSGLGPGSGPGSISRSASGYASSSPGLGPGSGSAYTISPVSVFGGGYVHNPTAPIQIPVAQPSAHPAFAYQPATHSRLLQLQRPLPQAPRLQTLESPELSPVHSGMFEDLDDLGHYADPGNNTNQGPFTGKNRSYEYDR